jgi:hypothetical protein
MDEMKYRQFLDAVRTMRELQKQYFKWKSPSLLDASKRAEKYVDTLLETFEPTLDMTQEGDETE